MNNWGQVVEECCGRCWAVCWGDVQTGGCLEHVALKMRPMITMCVKVFMETINRSCELILPQYQTCPVIDTLGIKRNIKRQMLNNRHN